MKFTSPHLEADTTHLEALLSAVSDAEPAELTAREAELVGELCGLTEQLHQAETAIDLIRASREDVAHELRLVRRRLQAVRLEVC